MCFTRLGGAVTSLASTGDLGLTILSKATKKEFNLQEWLKDHTHKCYKWIYYDPTTEGELQACEDKNKSISGGAPTLIFYLWWLKKDVDYNKRYEVERISGVDSNNLISFIFKNGRNNDKKLKIHTKAPEALRDSAEKLANTNKNLSEICKISGSNLTCTDTDSSKTYTLRVQETTAYF